MIFMKIYVPELTAESMTSSFLINIVLSVFLMSSYYIGFVYSRKDAYKFQWDQKTKSRIEPSADGKALYKFLLVLETAVLGISHYCINKIFFPDNLMNGFLIIIGCLVYFGILNAFNSGIYKNIFPYNKKRGFLLNIIISMLLGTILLLYLPYILGMLGGLVFLYVAMKIMEFIELFYN